MTIDTPPCRAPCRPALRSPQASSARSAHATRDLQFLPLKRVSRCYPILSAAHQCVEGRVDSGHSTAERELEMGAARQIYTQPLSAPSWSVDLNPPRLGKQTIARTVSYDSEDGGEEPVETLAYCSVLSGVAPSPRRQLGVRVPKETQQEVATRPRVVLRWCHRDENELRDAGDRSVHAITTTVERTRTADSGTRAATGNTSTKRSSARVTKPATPAPLSASLLSSLDMTCTDCNGSPHTDAVVPTAAARTPRSCRHAGDVVDECVLVVPPVVALDKLKW